MESKVGWYSPEEIGVSPEKIEEIIEQLWATEDTKRSCPDCGVKPGESHWPDCDVPHCSVCGRQALMCVEHDSPLNTWSGRSDLDQICKDNKLVTFWGTLEIGRATNPDDIQWMFDYNRGTVINQRKLSETQNQTEEEHT